MSYLEKWWRDASDVKKESFINLVQNGQLEIVGGGWVMNDEVKLIIVQQVCDFFMNNLWICNCHYTCTFKSHVIMFGLSRSLDFSELQFSFSRTLSC